MISSIQAKGFTVKQLFFFVFVLEFGKDWSGKIVFAIDSSSEISDETFQDQIHFVEYLAKYLKLTTRNSSAALIAFGDACKALIPLTGDFANQLCKVGTKPTDFHGKARRIDSALMTAADTFDRANIKSIASQGLEKDQLVVLMTAGIQSWNDPTQGNPDALSSAVELLQEKNVKVIIVTFGTGIDFRELVHIIDRPQDLFPLVSFNDLTEVKAQKIAQEVLDTAGNVVICVLQV